MPRPPQVWTFNVSYDWLARMTGKSINTLQKLKQRNDFDPEKPESLLYFMARHGTPEVRRKMLLFGLEREIAFKPGETGYEKGRHDAQKKGRKMSQKDS